MYCHSVTKRDDPKNATAQLLNPTPKANSVIALNFNANGILDDLDAPFLSQEIRLRNTSFSK